MPRPIRRLTPRRRKDEPGELLLSEFLVWQAARFEASAAKCDARDVETIATLRGRAKFLRRRAAEASDVRATPEQRRRFDWDHREPPDAA